MYMYIYMYIFIYIYIYIYIYVCITEVTMFTLNPKVLNTMWGRA